MKLLFVYRFLTCGGVEAVLSTRLRALPARGYDARAWFLHDGGGWGLFTGLEDRVHVGDVAGLAAFVRREEPTLVAVIDAPDAFSALGSLGSACPRLLLEVHTTYPGQLGYVRHLGGPVPAAVAVPSRSQAEMVRRLVGGRLEVVVLPNPLAPEFVAEEGLDAPPAASPVLLWIGRLDEHKDWRAFLEIGRSVAERVGRVELWMIGGSVGAAGVGELEREARRAGVLGRLRWLPRLSQLGVRASIDLARASPGVMIATSRAESFGMTVAEAMARRCPVVVPDAGPFSEYVEDGVTGMLYRPGSRADAAERAALLLRDTMLHRRLGSESRRAVLERYATDVAIDSLVALLRTIGTVGGPAVPSPAGAAGTIVVPRASAP